VADGCQTDWGGCPQGFIHGSTFTRPYSLYTHQPLDPEIYPKAYDLAKKLGTRVFKKSSPNGKITTYLGKRDFLDHGDHIDPIDGVVLVDPEYLKVDFMFSLMISEP
jgi:hypothetical protein